MEQIAYKELENRKKPTTTIEESSETYDCYELANFNILNTLITTKVSEAKYVHVESLWEPEQNAQVYNLMFFDKDEEHVGGCELTNQKLFWDDDETEQDSTA
jgi:hypothetical protein